MPESRLSPSDATTRARIAAYALHKKRDAKEITAPARKAFLARFEDEVDPERLLAEPERQRRAEHAKKEYFTRLALKSARRRQRSQAE